MVIVDHNGWEEWRNHVLSEIGRLADEIEVQNRCTVEKRDACEKRFGGIETRIALNRQSLMWFSAGVSFAISFVVAGISAAIVTIVQSVFRGGG